MNKKILSLLLVFVLAFTACTGKEAAKTETKPATTEAKTETKKEEKKEEKTEAKTEEKSEAKNATPADFKGKTLSVLATSDKYAPFFEKFTEKTGASVQFLSMSSGEVLTKIEAEGKSLADVWFGGGIDAFMKAKEKGLLEQYKAKGLENVPAGYKDADDYWLSKGLTVVGFLANNSILKEKGLEVPKTWEELADPKYKGEVIMSDPAVSGTNYAAIKGLLDKYGEQAGWEYLTKLNDNIGFYGKRGKDPQEKTVAGEFAVGIIPVDKSAFKAAEDNGLTVVYPEDGIPWVPEGVAIFKNSPEPEIAKAFIDFMLEDESLKMLAELDGKDKNQLLKDGIQGLDLGLPKDKLIKQDLTTFGSMREDILAKFTKFVEAK